MFECTCYTNISGNKLCLTFLGGAGRHRKSKVQLSSVLQTFSEIIKIQRLSAEALCLVSFLSAKYVRVKSCEELQETLFGNRFLITFFSQYRIYCKTVSTYFGSSQKQRCMFFFVLCNGSFAMSGLAAPGHLARATACCGPTGAFSDNSTSWIEEQLGLLGSRCWRQVNLQI